MFWTLNPNRLRPYVLASEKKEKKRVQDVDFFCWLAGRYNHEAFSVTIANSFGKKKDAKYPESPYSVDTAKENEDRYANMTEEERVAAVKEIFSQLTSVESRIKVGGE